MIEAKYLTDKGWTDWEPVRLEYALSIASVYGHRSGNEFLFEDLPRGEQEYATGDDFEFSSIKFKLDIWQYLGHDGVLELYRKPNDDGFEYRALLWQKSPVL